METGQKQPILNNHSKVKRNQNEKIATPFQTLVKMSSGKNPSTFKLPPELTCHTHFPGTLYVLYKNGFMFILYAHLNF